MTQVDACVVETGGTASKITHTVDTSLYDLRNYLARPITLVSGTLPTTAGIVSGSVFQYNVLNTLFPSLPMRLAGVLGFRATLVFDLQLNTLPFHQGVVNMAWQYEPGAALNRTTLIPAAVQVPHVRINIEDSTKGQLIVPFCATRAYFPANAGPDENDGAKVYGRLGVTTTTPCSTTAGIASATYRILLSCQDVELIGVAPFAYSSYTIQGGVEKERDKPLSTGVGMLGKGLSLVGRGIPLLSSITEPASWFLGAASGALKSFGYSKPTVLEPPVAMYQMKAAKEENSDTPFMGRVVGAFGNNHLAMTDDLGLTNLDEMSISHIVSIPSIINVGTFTTANTIGTVLYATPLTPAAYWYRFGGTGNYILPTVSGSLTQSCVYPSNMLALANCFRQWHGSIRFKVTLSKTKFHGGRLICTYAPAAKNFLPTRAGDKVLSVPTAGDSITFGYSMIIDLRDGTEFEFVCPYLVQEPWLAFLESAGSFSMSVYEPLTANNNVPTTVHYIIEVSGEPDFGFAIPRPIYRPLVDDLIPGTTLKTQSGVERSSVKPVQLVEGNFNLDQVSQYTTGEVVKSIKTLIQIPGPLSNSDTTLASLSTIPIFPWWVTRDDEQLLGTRYCTYFAKMFNWACGSTDYHLYTNSDNAVAPLVSSGYFTPNGNDVANDYNFISAVGYTSSLAFQGDARDSFHVKFPAYSAFAKNAIGDTKFNTAQFWGATAVANPNDGNHIVCIPNVSVAPRAGTVTVISRVNAGDDARLIGFIGPSYLYLVNEVV